MAKKSRTRKRLSRQEIRDLDIEIRFLEGIVERDPRYADALRILSDDYLLRGHFDLGLGLDEQLVELDPENPESYFNLACSYALNGQYRGAADALSLAIDRGYSDWKWITREASFESFRSTPEFQEIQNRIQAILALNADL
ncbi:MAG: tetratricopeptide repeat protein [Verrucomicrobia bacterium]|nr:tetratricopeptide repeat protein [Verrucomicrobiota bacterium]